MEVSKRINKVLRDIWSHVTTRITTPKETRLPPPTANVGIPLPPELRLKIYGYLLPQEQERQRNEVRLVSRQFKAEYDHEIILEARKHRDRILATRHWGRCLANHVFFEWNGPDFETFIGVRHWKLRQHHRSSTRLSLHELHMHAKTLAREITGLAGIAPFHVLKVEILLLEDIQAIAPPAGEILAVLIETTYDQYIYDQWVKGHVFFRALHKKLQSDIDDEDARKRFNDYAYYRWSLEGYLVDKFAVISVD